MIVGGTAAVSAHAMRPGRYTPAEVVDLTEILQAAFAVSGGRHLPTEPRMESTMPSTARSATKAVVRLILLAIAGLVALAISIAVLEGLVSGIQQTVTPPSKQTVLERRAEFRALAEERARGHVRGPRLTEAGSTLTFTYRRGRRCRVTVAVDRFRLASALRAPAVASTGCRPRR